MAGDFKMISLKTCREMLLLHPKSRSPKHHETVSDAKAKSFLLQVNSGPSVCLKLQQQQQQ